MIARETVYSALFNLVKNNIVGMKTVSRRLRHWDDVSPAEQPAIFMVQKNEVPAQIHKLPTKWDKNVELYVYVHSGDDPQASPAEMLNPILDNIEYLFPTSEESDFQPLKFQNLGGLVYRVWISGPIETSEGVLGAQEVAIVPLQIETDE